MENFGALLKSTIGNLKSIIGPGIVHQCIVRKNWDYPPTTSGSYGRQAGRRNTAGFQILYRLSYSDFTLLHCYHIVIIRSLSTLVLNH